ncbi:MAG: class A beta-lactamase-related serine hydrolase, partial [Clostridia bacterium]|nr:class A beta-lactamase-related serine hydrolase [Clostridia bacterium]
MIDKARLQAVMDDMIVRGHTPSVSLTIYDNGEVTSLSAGLRDREQNAAADENTMYAIGSSTKAFVSAALCILCDDGKLTLEDPIVKHIPEFRMYDDYVTTHLTVRDILVAAEGP